MDREQIIADQIEKLPPELKQFVVNSGWIEKTRTIAQNNRLTPEQSSSLEDEVLLVVIGLDLRKNFTQNLRDNLALSADLANIISSQITQNIFSPIKDLLPTEIEPETDPSRELEQPHDLIGDYKQEPAVHSVAPDEEKVSPTIGTPAQKLGWEERKQKVPEQNTGNTYSKIDPYREPFK